MAKPWKEHRKGELTRVPMAERVWLKPGHRKRMNLRRGMAQARAAKEKQLLKDRGHVTLLNPTEEEHEAMVESVLEQRPDAPDYIVAGLHHGLTPVQLLAAQKLGGGAAITEVAAELHIPLPTIKQWIQKQTDFQEVMYLAAVDHNQVVTALLMDGERKAAQALVSALDATTSKGTPMWKERVTAAVSLLDRAGARGRPVERQVSASVSAPSEQLEAVILKALKDPTVRAWVRAEHPTLLAQVAEVDYEERTAGVPAEPSPAPHRGPADGGGEQGDSEREAEAG